MRAPPLSTAAVVALLVLAGCVGSPGTSGTEPSPDVSPEEFPNASAIDQSVFERHATAMGTTSFTLVTVKNRTDRVLRQSETNFTHMNGTARILAEPDASQYLVHSSGYFSGNGSTYSNGSAAYVLSRENDWTAVRNLTHRSVFNESSEWYLWRGVFDNRTGTQLDYAAIDATYERKGVETVRGVPVMRYEATGVDALEDSWAGGENASSWFEDFSAVLLLDENGVIRYYEYEFVWTEYNTRRMTKSYALSDVGSTDVEQPDWAANATADS